MRHLSETIEISLGLIETSASLYLSAPAQLLDHQELAPVSHAIRQAWSELGLSAVICVDDQPTAYIKEQKRFTKDQKERLLKFLWNQGTAPQLILIEETRIEVHSALARPPSKAGQSWSSQSLVESLDRLADDIETHRLWSFLKRIETGQFYRDYPAKFSSDQAVDKNLLNNLRYVRNRLVECGCENIEHLHALLGRLLFISFLEARKFIGSKHFPGRSNSLIELFDNHADAPRKGIDLLYDKLFASLQKEFNGSMFTSSLDEEKSQLSPEGFILLSEFFQGHEIDTGQTVLPFDTYDFATIPVETISAIYEDFLHAEDSKAKHELGAYYTPRHLAEMVVNMAARDGKKIENWKFFDPSCGSGIFLVIAFNLLAEHWLYRSDPSNHQRNRSTKINQLIEMLCNQIRGVDLNPTACRIAAFSLYLAIFEKVRPVDLDEFKKKLNGRPILPNLLEPTPRNSDNTAVITCSDFNRLPEDFPRDFNCVIGNPPWKNRGTKQLAFPFVDKAGGFVCDGGNVCFVLPTTMLVLKNSLLNQDWLSNHFVSDVMNLADYQNVLFTGSTLPALILKYTDSQPTKEDRIRYYTPKVTRYDPRQGLIPLEANDLKEVSYRDILQKPSSESFRLRWITNFWGSKRDLNLISRLRRMPRLGNYFEENATDRPIFRKGVGFQPYYSEQTKGSPEELDWNLTDPYLVTDQLGDLVVSSNILKNQTLEGFLSSHASRKGAPASLDLLRRKPENFVFEPPMVLGNKGFTTAAFCSSKARFQDAIHSISAPRKFEPYLKFLTALFNSDLAKYFMFFCAPGWIAGRKQIHQDDKMLLPFPMPGSPHSSRNAGAILEQIEQIFDGLEGDSNRNVTLKNDFLIQEARERLNELIFQYYGIGKQERILIKDACEIWAPSTRKQPTSRNVPAATVPTPHQINSYAKTLCHVLNSWAKTTNSEYRISLDQTYTPPKNSLRLLALKISNETKRKRGIRLQEPEDILFTTLRKVEAALSDSHPPFQYLRGLTYYDGDRIFLLKPDTLRHWAQSTALNDADDILAALREKFYREEETSS